MSKKNILHKFIPLLSVMFAYEQCLLCLGHHPDVWYEASQYLSSTSMMMQEKGVSFILSVFILSASDRNLENFSIED